MTESWIGAEIPALAPEQADNLVLRAQIARQAETIIRVTRERDEAIAERDAALRIAERALSGRPTRTHPVVTP